VSWPRIRGRSSPFGIHGARRRRGPRTATEAYNFQAFLGSISLAVQVWADGRENLVRNVNFVGTPLSALRTVLSAGDTLAATTRSAAPSPGRPGHHDCPGDPDVEPRSCRRAASGSSPSTCCRCHSRRPRSPRAENAGGTAGGRARPGSTLRAGTTRTSRRVRRGAKGPPRKKADPKGRVILPRHLAADPHRWRCAPP